MTSQWIPVWKGFLLGLWVLTVWMLPSCSKGGEPDVDHLAIAAILVKDGFYGRAATSLKKVESYSKDEDARRDLLWGMVFLGQKKYEESRMKIRSSLRLDKSSEAFLYLAEVESQLKNWGSAKKALENVKGVWSEGLPYVLLKAQILWFQGSKSEGWNVLSAAEATGLSRSVILKKKFQYLIEEKLYFSAFEIANRDDVGLRISDRIAMASTLRLAKKYALSLRLLQKTRFKDPDHVLLNLEMTQVYLSLGQPFSGALLLEEASRTEKSLAFEASELLRQVGKNYRSGFLNLFVEDKAKRLTQKLALALGSENYDGIEFLVPQLAEAELLEDEELRYASAYALYRTGRFSGAMDLLDKIQNPDLYAKSVELRREIQKCEALEWSCFESI